MKKLSVFLFAMLLSCCIGLQAQDSPELVEDKIVFADHEEFTSLISSLPPLPTRISPLVFEIDGYRFTFAMDNNEGGILRDYLGRLLVMPNSLITVERLDGNAMCSILWMLYTRPRVYLMPDIRR